MEMTDKKYKIGYTTGVFDMFHIGHLNIIKNAKKRCETLVVGITTDEVMDYCKGDIEATITEYKKNIDI